ncbi:MAG: hypothetical protein LBG92_04575 [Prevotellaceae bacterium]|jgi:hypothetical protein|nr:hypothetical protein [Prevotellaceae bacterium]
MNKKTVLIIITAGLFMTACLPESHNVTTEHYITNTTGKKIVHELVGNHYFLPNEMNMSDTVRRFYSDGTVSTKESEWLLSRSMYIGRDFPDQMFLRTYIYSINDTVSLYWSGLRLNFEENQNYDYFYERDWNNDMTVFTYNLMVSDSLLSLMHKDYTMLEKFPEYYK